MSDVEQSRDDRPNDNDPDEWATLMARAQAGDHDAYRRLLRAITPYIRAIARKSLREPADTEDAVQDVLTTLHTVRHTFDPHRPFRPWLAGIARYRLLDRLRGAGRRAAREVALGPEHETFSANVTNHEEVATDAPALRRAIKALPAGQRQAIELTKLQEMSLKDASLVSGISVGALKVATHRGMVRLRQLLTGKDV